MLFQFLIVMLFSGSCCGFNIIREIRNFGQGVGHVANEVVGKPVEAVFQEITPEIVKEAFHDVRRGVIDPIIEAVEDAGRYVVNFVSDPLQELGNFMDATSELLDLVHLGGDVFKGGVKYDIRDLTNAEMDRFKGDMLVGKDVRFGKMGVFYYGKYIAIDEISLIVKTKGAKVSTSAGITGEGLSTSGSVFLPSIELQAELHIHFAGIPTTMDVLISTKNVNAKVTVSGSGSVDCSLSQDVDVRLTGMNKIESFIADKAKVVSRAVDVIKANGKSTLCKFVEKSVKKLL